MNDADIIKALDCCKDSAMFQKCTECPYDNDAIGVDCLDKILADAFDLIKRQKVEIERLQAENAKLKLNMSYMKEPNTIGDIHEMGAW